MKLSEPWRMFRRMQYSALALAGLIYAGAVVHAWRVLPGGAELKAERTLLFPAIAFGLSLVAILLAPPLRNALSKHLWISFRTGFGQSVISVMVGVGVLILLAGFIYWNTWNAARGAAPYPAGVFSGYAA